ncbi:MAG: hypothetical protein ABEH64_05220 [Salinirussus sp.]
MNGREAAGWGVVGALCFLVLALGYQLLTTATIDPPVLAGGTIIVGMAATVTTYLLGQRIE